MKMKFDYHLHGSFSSDSRIDTEKLVLKAIERGYKSIAITEHFDFKPSEIAEYGIPAYMKYHRQIMHLKDKYRGRIDIIFGVEAGEYNRFSDLADLIFKFAPPEMVIGSIHSTDDYPNYSVRLEKALQRENLITYYQENLDMATRSNIDILGHLGIHKRYLSKPVDESFCLDIIDDIFRKLIERGINLEVNYSPLRREMRNVLPEPELLKRYRELGGERITIGSDSHRLEDFDDYFDRAIEILRGLGFRYIFYLEPLASGEEHLWKAQHL